MFDAGSGHYGSTVWDTMSGERSLTINVCDECLLANRSRVGMFITLYQRPEVEMHAWEPDMRQEVAW